MKPKLLASMRNRRRYLVFKVLCENEIEYFDIKNAILSEIIRFIGTENFGRAEIKFIDEIWNKRLKIGAIRCNAPFVDRIKVALALLHQVSESPIIINVIRVCGTIDSINRFIKSM